MFDTPPTTHDVSFGERFGAARKRLAEQAAEAFGIRPFWTDDDTRLQVSGSGLDLDCFLMTAGIAPAQLVDFDELAEA